MGLSPMTGPTAFNATVDPEGRITIPKACRQFLGIDAEDGGTVSVAVATEPFDVGDVTGGP